eukprot:478171-Amphidinium_carterae.8
MERKICKMTDPNVGQVIPCSEVAAGNRVWTGNGAIGRRLMEFHHDMYVVRQCKGEIDTN